jgi:hypothetical protein
MSVEEDGVRGHSGRVETTGIAGQRPQQLGVAQPSANDHVVRCGEARVKAAVEPDLQYDAGLGGSRDSVVGLGEGDGHWLFAEDGLAGAGGGLDQDESVRGASERNPRVVHRRIEIFQHERHSVPFTQCCDTVQRPRRSDPHVAADVRGRLDWQASVIQTGTVQVQPRAAQLLRHRHRLFCGAQQLRRAVVVGQRASDVASHR